MSESKIRTIQGLIAKAEGTENEDEKATYYAKAQQLMAKYAIEEAELDMTREASQRTKPESINVVVCRADAPVAEQLANLLTTVCRENRAQVVFYGLNAKQSYQGNLFATVVGFPSDLRFIELLYTSLSLHLLSGLEPKPDTSLGFDENVYRLHESGVKWKRIAELMNKTFAEMDGSNPAWGIWRKAVRPGPQGVTVLVPWPDGKRLISAYRRHCQIIGETPRAIQSPVSWQRNFAAGYVQRINARFWEARSRETSTALAIREQDVTDKFNEMFPADQLKAAKSKKVRFDGEARAAGHSRANQADLSGGKNRAGASKRPELS